MENEHSGISSYKGTNAHGQGPTLMTSSSPNFLPMPHLQMPLSWVLEFLCRNLGRIANIQSITPTKNNEPSLSCHQPLLYKDFQEERIFFKKLFNIHSLKKQLSGYNLALVYVSWIYCLSTHCVLSSSYRSLFILLPGVQALKLCGFLPHSSTQLALYTSCLLAHLLWSNSKKIFCMKFSPLPWAKLPLQGTLCMQFQCLLYRYFHQTVHFFG